MTQLLRKNLIKVITNRILINECIGLNTNRYINRSVPVLGIKGTPIKMPSLSPTMTEGTIVKWFKREGDSFSAGDVLCEVQTDKAIVGLELEEEGIIAKIILPDDTKDIKVGTLIAVMVEEGQDWKDVDIPVDSEAKPDEPSKQQTSQTISKKDEKPIESKKIIHNLIAPTARNLLHHFGIDSQLVISSGPRNTLLKQDVINYIESKRLQPKQAHTEPITETTKQTQTAKQPAFIDIELTNMRKTIAKRLTQSKSTIPHSYMTINCLLNGVSDCRKKLKQSAVNVSVNDFIIKAASIALKKVPQINCSWIEETSSLQLLSNIDISVAVATPTGLITPIVKNANKLSLEEINKIVKELAEKAKLGKLQPQEFIGGSFSISNLGMFGITEFTAVINPPQCAILAIGTSRVILDDSEKLCQVMTVQLSFDSRAIDEEDAAKFLFSFKSAIEDVDTLQNSDGSDNRRLYALIS